MRLLERNTTGDLVLKKFIGTNIPAYAILSHTWGKEEVSLQEVESGTRKNNDGWKKIDFCAKQANADGLRYIWVDTCCIDKRDAVELSEAINSMFRWYRKSARCYVYLSDVSVQGAGQNAFRKSRWFTRGWTFQELIAPTSVDFCCYPHIGQAWQKGYDHMIRVICILAPTLEIDGRDKNDLTHHLGYCLGTGTKQSPSPL